MSDTWTFEQTQESIIQHQRAAMNKLAGMFTAQRSALEVVQMELQAKQDALADALPELTAAAELIGKVRQMVAFHAPYLDIANVIDAWMKVEPPHA